MAIIKEQAGHRNRDETLTYHKIVSVMIFYDEDVTRVYVHSWRDQADRESGHPPRRTRDYALEGANTETRDSVYGQLKELDLFAGAEDLV